MITKNDWDAAAEEFMLAERERLGGPPTPEEVIAYSRGELSEADATRVRALLVYYPDLADILDEPAPPVRAKFSVARALPIAAAVLFAIFAGISQWQVQRLTRERDAPRVLGERHALMPLQQRRGASEGTPYLLPARQKSSQLELLVNDTRTYPAYRVSIVDARGKEQWSAPIERTQDNTFELSVFHAFLGEGTYRIRVYGVQNDSEELLQSYAIRIAGGS